MALFKNKPSKREDKKVKISTSHMTMLKTVILLADTESMESIIRCIKNHYKGNRYAITEVIHYTDLGD